MRTMMAVVIGLCLIGAATIAGCQQTGQPQRPTVNVDQVFTQWDKNGDGKLTADEVPGPQLFKTLDKNGDGVVTKEEAAAFLANRGAQGQGQGQPGQGQQPGQNWRNPGMSQGAPLPPAENFQPRPHGAEAAAAGLKPEVLAKIDTEMQRHVAAKNIAGLIGLIHHNGQRGYCEAFGMQDLEANKPMAQDSIFRLMSMTKPLIALTALVLYDEGKFGLDDPIATFLPEWASPKVLENGQLVPAVRPLTPRMLMSHSSGLYYGQLEGTTGGGVAAMAYQAGRAGGATLKEFSEAAAREPLKFQPGAGWNYGISIDILGRYIEAVAGKPLDEVMREKLTGPLKMVDTDFWVPPDKVGRLCQLYRQPSPGVLEPGRQAADPKVKPTLFMGGHGMLSTVGDYERFCRMILNRGELDGVRVLKPETVDLIFQNQVPAPGQRYGLGGVVDGKGGYGWGGADGTQFFIDRTNNLLAIFMTQTDWYKAPTYNAFRPLVFEAAGIEARPQWAPPAGGAGQ